MNTNQIKNLPRTIVLEYSKDEKMRLTFVDQRCLPDKLSFKHAYTWQQVSDAIKTLEIRGAPAIGISGAAAVALWAAEKDVCSEGWQRQSVYDESFFEELSRVATSIAATRPTAVNLLWGVARMQKCVQRAAYEVKAPGELARTLFREVKLMEAEDESTNRIMAERGAALLQPGCRVLTHCNAGSLATVFYGTALGVVYTASAQGKIMRVYVDETRPVCQGGRLTVWELARAGVPCTLICDNMAASLMAQAKVDVVLVGADRIAANGDVANKIGTYGLALLAYCHRIPFYVVAPSSSIDSTLNSGSAIPIEQRPTDEVMPRALVGVEVLNPAFDITPAKFIHRIITEKGVYKPDKLVY